MPLNRPVGSVAIAASLLALFLVAIAGMSPRIYSWWFERRNGPILQREFGFLAGHESIGSPAGSQEVFLITKLEPTGRLARAGFELGDIPVGYKHGFAAGFYADLELVRNGATRSLRAIRRSEYERGLGPEAWRTITLTPTFESGGSLPLAVANASAPTGGIYTSYSGFSLGVGDLGDVQAKLGKATLLESGEAGEYEARLCYRTAGSVVTFLSSELGGPNHRLLGVELAAIGNGSGAGCATWPTEIDAPPDRIAGLKLGMSQEEFVRELGATVQHDGALIRAFFESRRQINQAELASMSSDIRAKIKSGALQSYFDVLVTVEGTFKDGLLQAIQVWRVETF